MLDAFVEAALADLAAGGVPSPVPLLVMLRVYAATGRDDLGEAIGRALAACSEEASHRATLREPQGRPGHGRGATALAERSDWLRVFSDAARLTDDPRVRDAAESTAADLVAGWAGAGFAERAAAVEAVLGACPLIDAQRFARPAIDELERLVAADYEPGVGLRGRGAAETVAAAGALVAAFDLTGRLAYPMLAEELIRIVRPELASAPAEICCAAARVFRRLAKLHEDEGYRATAVIAPDADYAGESLALVELARRRVASSGERAALALALTESPERS